jgi:exosortase H (IPTLxxWG-CTERM-specific)
MVIPLTYLAATSSGWIMNIWGAGATVVENTLMTSQYSINVVDGCNGVYATAILISGIVAYPSKITHKALGALIGIIAIFVLNLVRVISLFYFGQYYPDIFREAHVYVWQPIIILWAIYIWDFWRRKIESR